MTGPIDLTLYPKGRPHEAFDIERMRTLIQQEPKLEQKFPDLWKALHDEGLSPPERQRRIAVAMAEVKKTMAAQEHLHADYAEQSRELKNIQTWLEGSPCLEKNEHSRLHHLWAAMDRGYVLANDIDMVQIKNTKYRTESQPFVVSHNWARAFENAGDFSAETVLGKKDYRLPYPYTAFEFMFSGRCVIVTCHEADEISDQPEYALFLRSGNVWVMFLENDDKSRKQDPLLIAALSQIRAICIALEAQVAERDVIRAPAKLNKKRESKGELPLYDYHVVSLSRRAKAAPNPNATHDGTKRRLHFVRGHWKHYKTHNTWVKWFLRGDPDLGFIDKEYKL